MTDEQVRESLVRWLADITGTVVIKSHQSVPRPDGPYLAVERQGVIELTQNPFNHKYETLDTINSAGFNEIKQTPLVELEWTMFVFSYGRTASEELRKVKQAFYIPQKQELLIKNDSLYIHELGAINEIPEQIDGKWEDRFQMNVMLRGLTNDGFVIDSIEEHRLDIATM